MLGRKNLVYGALSVFGDFRTAVAYNDNGAKEQGLWANRLNLDVDLKLTSTERIHAFFRPLDDGAEFSRCEFSADDDDQCRFEGRGNPRTLFFEGDIGNILAGITDDYSSFDLPFSFGLMPLLFQNGIWMDDAVSGLAFAIPALNSPMLDISNMDITFFTAFDKVSTAAMRDNLGRLADHNVNLYAVAAFIEATQGYWELGAGYVDGQEGLDPFDYVNLTGAFTRRYGGWLSNSVRVFWATGQGDVGLNRRQTADGVAIIVENSLVTHLPVTLVPYFNVFVGRDRPQSLARDGGAGGILKNVGINFETDGLTGFPKLDDTANDTFGGALGVNYLFNLEQQIVVEVASVQTIGGNNRPGRAARGDEYGFGVRYQRPLTLAWIFRTDAMYGARDQDDNFVGMRMELRRKF